MVQHAVAGVVDIWKLKGKPVARRNCQHAAAKPLKEIQCVADYRPVLVVEKKRRLYVDSVQASKQYNLICRCCKGR